MVHRLSGNLHFNHQMASSEGKKFIKIEKFNINYFNLCKINLKMVLTIKYPWEIVHGLELPPPFSVNDNNNNAYEQQYKKPSPSLLWAWLLQPSFIYHDHSQILERINIANPCILPCKWFTPHIAYLLAHTWGTNPPTSHLGLYLYLVTHDWLWTSIHSGLSF